MASFTLLPEPEEPPLRDKAETLLATAAVQEAAGLSALSALDTAKMVHELRVHQIELEMQNEELRLAQAELEDSRALYFDLFDMAPVGYVRLTPEGVILEANFTAANLLGVARQPLKDQPFIRFVDVSSRDDFHLLVRQMQNKYSLHACELRMVTNHGQVFWAQLEATLVPGDKGTSVIRLTLTNVTERKRAEEDLRISAAAFESIAGMFVTNADNTIQRINAAFTRITGYEAEDVLGKNPRLLQSGRHDAAFYTAIWADVTQLGGWQGEIWNRRKDGSIFPEWLSITAVKNAAGAVTHHIGSFTDITARKEAEDAIRSLAFYDPLTQLPNRRLLMDRLDTALALAVRHKRQGALLFIDLDDFKTLNDTLGHDQGDCLLQQVAQRLGTCTREGDTVARLGGDEFVVLLENLGETTLEAATQAEAVGQKVLLALNEPYGLEAHVHHSTASVGITLFGTQVEGKDEPLKRADLAMYQAKAAGRNTVRFFDPQTQLMIRARAEMEAGLREALAAQQFELHYQTQVLGDGTTAPPRVTGVEALVRWRHPVRGLVSPGEFIPSAEETGLIVRLGHWVLQTACAQLALWAQQPTFAHLSISVNISARQISQNDFVEQVRTVLAQSGAKPSLLKLELTESVLVTHVEDVIAKMKALQADGVGFSLDDFGTGYSSLTYLKRLPIYQLKIDQGFVSDIMNDANDAAIARMVIALAESLGLSVVAEGVETADQRAFLAAMGCSGFQGYLFGRPLPIGALEASLL